MARWARSSYGTCKRLGTTVPVELGVSRAMPIVGRASRVGDLEFGMAANQVLCEMGPPENVWLDSNAIVCHRHERYALRYWWQLHGQHRDDGTAVQWVHRLQRLSWHSSRTTAR